MNKLWNYEDYVKHLSHRSSLVRRWAFEALEEHYPNRFTDEISNLVGDKDTHLACAAPRYLAKHRAVQHAPKILECFKNSHGNVKSNCALALGKMKYEPAVDAMLEAFLTADIDESLFGVLTYFGNVKREDCREALQSAVIQIQNSLVLNASVHNLLLHYHSEDVSLVLDKYCKLGMQDNYSDSLLKMISSALGGDGYFHDLTQYGRYDILKKPNEVIDILVSRNPTITLQDDARSNIVKAVLTGAYQDIATMIMWDVQCIIRNRYPEKETPGWLTDMYGQDTACLSFFEEVSKRPSIWKQAKNTKYSGRNLVALVLAVFFSVKERGAYVKGLSPHAGLDDLIQALAGAGSDLPETIQYKIKELRPIAELNNALTKELRSWGDIWTVRLMGRIGSNEFVSQLIRVLNQSDSMDYIYSDALRAMTALDESADDQIIEAIRNRRLGDWESFPILERLPYAEAYDIAIEMWYGKNDGDMDSYEMFAGCLQGIGDPRGIEKLREVYARENDATYIGDALECLAVLHHVDVPELPEIRKKRKDHENRQKARIKKLDELAYNYGNKEAEGAVGSQGQLLPFKREVPKVGRNEPCPCGSGKKYKKCCLKKK